MKQKNYLLLYALSVLSFSTFAQQGLQKRADSLFHKFAFVDASKAYKKLIEKDYNTDYATRQLGDCYAYMRNPEKAAVYYKNAVAQDNVPIEYYYKYAQALRGIEDYKASRVWLKKFNDAGGVINENKITKDQDFINAIFNAKHQYFLKDVKINSELSDFGAFEHDGKLYFASSADKGVSTKHIYAWNEQPFLDVYVTEKNADTIVHHLSKLKGDVNSVYHDGPVTITKDGKTMYFSRNNYDDKKLGKDRNGISNLKIYKASLVDGEWTNIKELPFNDDNYSVGHPTLNKDETKLYFASDMPGGLGGSDIYYVDINKNNGYGMPQNAGNIINTKRNELFPFINTEDILFFSSDGHLGLGLLDIFATVYDEEGTLTDVVNLGIPVNSNKDDFSFFMNTDGITGYFASNRDGGVGDDDIYAYNRIPRLKLDGTVKDIINNTPVENAIVTLLDTDGNKIAYVETDKNGEYYINIDRDTDYLVTANKDGYPQYETSVTTKGLDDTIKSITANFEISPTQKQEEIIIDDLGPIYFNFDSAKIRKDDSDELARIVNLMVNKYPEMTITIESHTDSRGPSAYNDILSSKRARSTYDYLISKGVDPSRIIEYKGFGESQLVNDCDGTTPCSEAQHQLNRRTNFIIIKVK
ncbi:OmpA family protein [Jejuia pallidilutea]|uniref:Outer membrane lipoprotein Omp16 n=1 Tax=Jejuia pallidilutea TaxID=504487 RepID=A0A090W0F6_9FLAO|nr:OmpA family protein [Jejuia pallidilutea]GAL68959.1 outer membrane lipoprotein omp16 precursor [Jejuia pallidilutea]GAL89617.1 outer membrane lipoprotein Omp16 precursor [Jejuia pallidilutea]